MPRNTFDAATTEFAHAVGMLVRRARAASALHELSWTETNVLKRLAREGPATTADLARAEKMRPQSMRPVIAALEEMGFVERKPHASDGRQVNLQLTAIGAAEQKSMECEKRTWLAQTFQKLSQQERETLFAAGRIIKRIVESDS